MMDESIKMSFDFAWNLSEQIITLSTLILGFTATFAKEFKTAKKSYLTSISLAWAFFLLSILFGLLSFMALTGALTAASGQAIPANAKWFAGMQIASFGLGSIMIATTGWRVYRST